MSNILGERQPVRMVQPWAGPVVMVDVVVRKRHIIHGDPSDAYMHPVAIAATEARLPGAWVCPGMLILERGERTESYFIPVEVWGWIQRNGEGREEFTMSVPVPPDWVEGATKFDPAMDTGGLGQPAAAGCTKCPPGKHRDENHAGWQPK